MSTSSADSARLTPTTKVELRCSCGKKYRVSAKKAGKKVRCKKCRLQLTVPGDPAGISLRTRKQILEELGIDAEAAEQAAEQEKAKVYTCGMCSMKIPSADVEGSYSGPMGLLCGPCQASTGACDPAPGADASSGEKPKKKKGKPLETWSTQGSEKAARVKGAGYGALFFVGIACFVHTIFAPSLAVTIPVALVVAAVGGHVTYKAHLPTPEPKKKSDW